MTNTHEDRILEKLDQLIRITAIQVAPEKSMTERARLMKLAGLDNRTIAEVLNTSDATIRTLTTNLKRRPSKPSSRPAKEPIADETE